MRIGNIPHELIKATIKPMGVPPAKDMASAAIQDATGNELIISGWEIEAVKSPERVRGQVNKYTTCALRGFGSFNVAMGRGLFGAEFQKSLSDGRLIR